MTNLSYAASFQSNERIAPSNLGIKHNRKRAIRYDKDRYRGRHHIENAFCRLKDFRRVATRHDKLAVNFLSGVAIATAIAFGL